MTTTAERALLALYDLLERTGVKISRNQPLPETVPARGLIILRDGDPGEPEVTLSPMTWHYVHEAEVEIYIQISEREFEFDDLKSAIGRALAADRRLGGAVDWAEAGAPAPQDLGVAGAKPIKAATIPVALHYATTDPLN